MSLRNLFRATEKSKRELTAKSLLAWERFNGPMQAAVAQVNEAVRVAQNTVARCLIEAEELNPNEWLFDMDNLVLIPKPHRKPEEVFDGGTNGKVE
jgi:hypothetical protein